MASDNFESGIRDLNRRFGGHHSDRQVLADEHLRLELYRVARNDLPVESYVALLLADADFVMADAALVELIDNAADRQSHAEFSEWSGSVLAAGAERRSFPSKRIREWLVLLSLDDLTIDHSASLAEGSDWLQRKAVERARSRAVLEAVAERGRTKRIRASAAERLRLQGGRTT